ncbi:hypothetical protein ACFE04_026977 [Oxalis oulophora]
MAKVVAYFLLTIAFIIFLTFSPNNQVGHSHPSENRRIGNKLPLPPFDPLLVRIKILKGGPHSIPTSEQDDDDVPNDEEFYGEDGHLNITMRLMILFPLVDKDPKDEFVSFDELDVWNVGQAIDRMRYRTQKELMVHDKDRDGSISFNEYLPQFSQEDIADKNDKGNEEARWWMEKFVNADVDQNGVLNYSEFNRNIDEDNDGKLDFEEFEKNVYHTYKHYIDYENPGANVSSAQQIFSNLDLNNDKFLDSGELRVIYRYLHPGELIYARSFTNYLMQEADDNKDGKLSLDEMLNNKYIFYDTVYYDEDDDDNYSTFHEEL